MQLYLPRCASPHQRCGVAFAARTAWRRNAADKRLHLAVGALDAGSTFAVVDIAANAEAGLHCRRGGQVRDHLAADCRRSARVPGDVAERSHPGPAGACWMPCGAFRPAMSQRLAVHDGAPGRNSGWASGKSGKRPPPPVANRRPAMVFTPSPARHRVRQAVQECLRGIERDERGRFDFSVGLEVQDGRSLMVRSQMISKTIPFLRPERGALRRLHVTCAASS